MHANFVHTHVKTNSLNSEVITGISSFGPINLVLSSNI